MRDVPLRREAPSYPIASVDHALTLIQLLRDTGPLRVADAASELGVAHSTAHRLLGMLVFRDFAFQDEERRYHPGPAVGQRPIGQPWTRELCRLARPHLERLTDRVGETSNLMIRVGARVRFLLTVRSLDGGAVGDRRGIVLPAIYTAGGRAMLASLSPASVETLLGGEQAGRSGDALPESERARLRRELAAVRSSGYARNLDDSELGLSALAMPVRDGETRVVAAVAVAVRSSRVARMRSGRVVEELRSCRDAVEDALAAEGFHGSGGH